MQYFVVMIDYGRRGREAIVDPEVTRREVISRIASGEYGNISFIHEIADGAVADVTEDVLAEAALPEIAPDEVDLQAIRLDHMRVQARSDLTRGPHQARAGPLASHQKHRRAGGLACGKIGMRLGRVLQRIGLVHLDLHRA